MSLGCSALVPPKAETARSELIEEQEAQSKPSKKKVQAKAKARVGRARLAPRKVGDYFVHRFSGSFRSGPLTLIERVVAADDKTLTVDYTLEDGVSDKTLRVELERDSERPRRVVELIDSGELEVPISAYEAMLAQTVFAPDVNDALLAEKKQTCLVGPKELDCEIKQYRVYVGDEEARLTVTESKSLPGRDVSGEVTAVDGSVIYRAELLEAGNTPRASDSMASK
jgi:hypothetical protein